MTIEQVADNYGISVPEARAWLREMCDVRKRLALTGGRPAGNSIELDYNGGRIGLRKMKLSNPYRKILTDDVLEIPQELRVTKGQQAKAYDGRQRPRGGRGPKYA